ncbi:MAG TPA: glycosyl hydrolase family 65 protein [Brevefilum sp.]
MMQFGYFDDSTREYVISRPDTPLPWINYLGAEDYFGLISNTGGGYSFYQDARLRRLTRYRYNNVPTDMGGRYLYLRDNVDGQFWSPTWMPTQNQLEDYSCRHGMGYTKIGSTYNGIRADLRYFVPPGETLEIWDVRIKNLTDEVRQLSAFSSIEFCLWDANDDATNFQRNLNIGELEVQGSVIYHKTEYRERRNHFAYFACSEPLDGFETQREAFLGAYRGYQNPQAVERDVSTNSLTVGWAPVGVHHFRFSLAPGETRRVIFLLGYFENPVDQKFTSPGSQNINKAGVEPTIEKYLNPQVVDQAFEDLKQYWQANLNVLQVATPDQHVNRMVNIWNAYQCMVTFNLSRSASYFESGIGRGMGFRDSNQDLLGFVQMVPERARQRILDLAGTQLESGGAYHQYQPLTKRGNDAVGGNFNDDPAWLVLGTAAYLKETADWDILEEAVQFDNKPGSEASLFEHLERSIQYTLDNIGPHGLPLIGRADWNDCLNLNTFSEKPGESFQTTTSRDGKVAESVVVAALFIMAANEMQAISDHLGMGDKAAYYQDIADDMAAVTREYGWDGDWFLRAYDHFGDVIGSRLCEDGKIFIEPQGLCAMAGIGLEDGMVKKALESVRAHLATEHGIVLLDPPYHEYHLRLGEISSYPPGYKENGSVFCHTNPWIMIAEAIVGDGDRAMDYYLRINPSNREAISDVHRSEPYVYAQTIAGKAADRFGEAKNSWLTGTAAWNFVAITQWILGIRPDYDGLRIEPVVPKDWNGFKVRRQFRGTLYDIEVVREGTGNNISLFVNGEMIEGTLVEALESPQVLVKVVIA